MGEVIRLDHARAPMRSGAGYRSGRSSWRGTPETRSTVSTRSGGTSSHCTIACTDIPIDFASFAGPPEELIARLRASLLSAMIERSSMALPKSQELLHCAAQVALYHAAMTLGARIKAARERLRPRLTQRELAEHFGISDKAVSGWERDEGAPDLNKMPVLRGILKVTYCWLLEGEGPPPDANSREVLLEDLTSEMMKSLRKQRSTAA